ncbi:MAG: SIMPL domain-containing protein [Christensenellaceae bacterium]|jgi:uncharacterized protein YggE|nr:SIMPL domain-containing protein [Christensenellaceae bacterium]
MKQFIRRTALALGALCLAVAVNGCKSQEQIQQQDDPGSAAAAVHIDLRSTLTVEGEGTVQVEPDMATLTLTVRTREEDASAAQQANAAQSEAVLAALQKGGVEDADIHTGALRVDEEYNYEKSPAAVVGYVALSEIEVTVREVRGVGDLISAAVAAGATNIQGPNYTFADESGAYRQALAAAMEDARAKAEAITGSAGVRLTPLPISIAEASSGQGIVYSPMAAKAEMSLAEDAGGLLGAPAPAGVIEITARVTVVYEVK